MPDPTSKDPVARESPKDPTRLPSWA